MNAELTSYALRLKSSNLTRLGRSGFLPKIELDSHLALSQSCLSKSETRSVSSLKVASRDSCAGGFSMRRRIARSSRSSGLIIKASCKCSSARSLPSDIALWISSARSRTLFLHFARSLVTLATLMFLAFVRRDTMPATIPATTLELATAMTSSWSRYMVVLLP